VHAYACLIAYIMKYR